MACRRLQLKKFELVNVNYQFLGAARLRIEASDADGTGADPNVFLYLQGQPSPVDQSVTAYPRGVASPVDMADYPVGAPTSETAYPFFRLSYIELDLRTIGLVNQVWTTYIREVGVLLEALDRLDALTLTDVVTVGTTCPEPPTSGSSASLSASG